LSTARKSKRLAKDELRRIIEFCRSVESKGLNPFLVEVKDLIAFIRDYFPNWNEPEELCLDVEAINQIASIIKMQSEWIKHRATSLYRDPFLIEEKLRSLPAEKITEVFLQCWNPIIELEQISILSLREAKDYWDALPSLDERWKKTGFIQTETGSATREEMIKQGILSSETFTSELEKLWEELKASTSKEGRIQYWEFIGAPTYDETVRRAFLTSFLVTYGYATLEIHPLEEKIFIRPREKIILKEEAQFFSFPISISMEEWARWRQNRKD